MLAIDRAISKRRIQQLACLDKLPAAVLPATVVPPHEVHPLRGELSGMAFTVEDTMDVQGVPTRGGMSLAKLFDEPAEVSDAWVEALKGANCQFAGKVKSPPFGHGLAGCFDEVYSDSSSAAPIHIGIDTYGWGRCMGALHGHWVFRAGVGRFIGGLPIVPSLDSPAVIASNWELLRQVLPIVLGHRESASTWKDPLAAEADTLVRKRLLLVEYAGHVTSPACRQSIRSRFPHFDCQSPIQTLASGRRILQKTSGAFVTLAEREAHYIHRYWLSEYESSYPPQLLRRLQRGARLSAVSVAAARDVQRQVRRLLLNWLDDWDVVALPLIFKKDNLLVTSDFAEGSILSQLAPIQLSGLPAFSIPLGTEQDHVMALQLIIRADC